MEKKVKLPIIIVGSVLAAILIAAVILCVIPVQPFKPFNDYNRVVIATTKNSNLGDLMAEENATNKAAFDKAISKTNYSVMHSLLEFSFEYSPEYQYKTEKNDKDKEVISKDADGNKIKKEMTYAEVIAVCVPSETAFVLDFYFTDLKTLKVEKSTVEYNAMRVAIATTEGQIKPMTIYLYNTNLIDGVGNPAIDEYRINPLTIHANTSPLFITLTDLSKTMSK